MHIPLSRIGVEAVQALLVTAGLRAIYVSFRRLLRRRY